MSQRLSLTADSLPELTYHSVITDALSSMTTSGSKGVDEKEEDAGPSHWEWEEQDCALIVWK